MPGFIKPVGGHMRMRFVQPGYDADDYDTPPNKVIFDSDDIGTLSVIQTGEYHITTNGEPPAERQIASWDLDFVPLCTFQFRPGTINRWSNIYSIPLSSYVDVLKINVRKTGIFVRIKATDIYIRYQAYNLVVT